MQNKAYHNSKNWHIQTVFAWAINNQICRQQRFNSYKITISLYQQMISHLPKLCTDELSVIGFNEQLYQKWLKLMSLMLQLTKRNIYDICNIVTKVHRNKWSQYKTKKHFEILLFRWYLKGGITMFPRHSLHNKLGVRQGRYLSYTIMCKFNIFII